MTPSASTGGTIPLRKLSPNPNLELLHVSLDGFRKIAHQMIAIGDLCRAGCALPRAVSVQARAISRNNGYLGMALKPTGKTSGGPVRQEVDNFALFQVHQQSTVVLLFAPSPIVYSENPHIAGLECCLARLNAAKDGIGASSHTESLEPPGAGQAAQSVPDDADNFA
jgi:hypothetical protein